MLDLNNFFFIIQTTSTSSGNSTDESVINHNLQYVIIDCSMLGYIDLTGVSTLSQVINEYDEIGVKVFLAGCRFKVRAMLHHTDFYKKVNPNILHLSVHDAVLTAWNSMNRKLFRIHKVHYM